MNNTEGEQNLYKIYAFQFVKAHWCYFCELCDNVSL